MASERERLLALRCKVDEQWRQFGGAGPFLLWWEDETVMPDGYDPDRPAPMSPHAGEIGKLVCLTRPAWSRGDRTTTEGTVFFDPADKLPKAIEAFRESANQLGCVLELKPQQLRPLIVETYSTIKAKDWTLAWIFKRPFDEQTDGCRCDILVPDAFGRLIECIDNELATLSRESPSSKPRAGNRIGKRTVWADFTIADSATPPRPTKRTPVKRIGRPPHRPPDTDANADKVIAEKWVAWREKGNPRSIAMFAKDFGFIESDVKAALDRHRKRSVK